MSSSASNKTNTSNNNSSSSNIVCANKKGIVFALTLATFLAAMDTTVVTMATPTITRELQGFELISLIFSVYLLTTTVATPICGKLADLYGRKRVLSVGIVVFIIGSICCGLSGSMLILIASRALQGLGAASIFTVSFTIVGDVFPLEQRAKIQGVMGSVWGIAGLVGPLVGGIFIDTLSWNWIFYINIPFGLLALVVLSRSLQERAQRREHRIDIAGTLTLSTALVVFLGIFTVPEFVQVPLEVYATISLVVTLVLVYIFIRIERRSPEPIIALALFTRTSTFVNLTVFLAAIPMICMDVYLPIFLQNVQGYIATVSGIMMLPITAAWLILSFNLGRLMRRFGNKIVMVASGVLLTITALLLLLVDAQTALLPLILILFVAGFAIGGSFSSSTIIIQDSVGYQQRGAAIALNALLKNLGQTIGIGILGGVYNLSITGFFAVQGLPDVNPSNLYETGENTVASVAASVSADIAPSVDLITQSLAEATHALFIVCLIVAVASLGTSLLIPKDTHDAK